MSKRWAIWWICALLALGSAVGAWSTWSARAEALRGWEDATRTLAMPERLPLAGVNVELTQYTPEQLDAELERIAAAGFVWVRQPFLWAEIEPRQGVFNWEKYDVLVQAVAAHPPLRLVAVLDGTPRWARHPLAPDYPYAPPESVQAFGNFAGAVAAQYGALIDFYQVWDEPNIRLHWGNLDPRPEHYAAMLREAYTNIHAADPSAQVIMAALAPTVERGPQNINEVDFLRALYAQGARDYFDAAAGKPYGFDTGPNDRRVRLDVLNFSRLILLREEMVRQGDAEKPLWGSNFGWNALPDDWRGPPSIWGAVSRRQQEQYTREAYARALREWPWVGGLILQHWQPEAALDDPIQGFALAPLVDKWLAHGPLFTDDALIPGRYGAQNPHTSYAGTWRFSALGADAAPPSDESTSADAENRITTRFRGTDFALILRRDDYLAYLYVTVDGQPANALPRNRQGEAFVVLTSPRRKPTLELIRVAEGLEAGVHTVEIVHRPAQGDDRWPIAGFGVGWAADTTAHDRALIACAVLGGLALLGLFAVGWRLPWGNVQPPTPAFLRRLGEWLGSVAVSAILLLGVLLSWDEALPNFLRRDPPALALTVLTAGVAAFSPTFVVTLAALGVLFVLIYNRPLLGVMLVIFWSAFFLTTLDLLFAAFRAVEAIFALTVAAVSLRALVGWTRGEKPAIRVHLSAADGLTLAFVAVGALALSWSRYHSTAFRHWRLLILEPALFYFLLRGLRLERRDWLWVADTLLFTGAAIAVVGLYLYLSGQNVVDTTDGARRLVSVYGSPNGVGLYLGRVLPFALAFVLLTPRGSWRWLWGLGSGAVMLLAVLLSQSRGAIVLGIPAALVVMLILWRGRRALGTVLIVLAAGALTLGALSLALPRLGDLFGSTFTFRRHLWYSSVQLLRERPLTGAGVDQFLYFYRSRYLLPEAWEEPNLSIPHNVLLNYWVNLGVLGVLVAAALQVWFWRTLWRVRARFNGGDPLLLAMVLGLGGGMAHMLAHGLVDVAYFSINLAFVFFLALAWAQWLGTTEGKRPSS